MTTTSRLPANEVGANMVTDNFNPTSPKQLCSKNPGRSFFEAARYRACASRTAPTAWASRLLGRSIERPRCISCAKPAETGCDKNVIDGKIACVDDSGRSGCSKIYCFSTGAE